MSTITATATGSDITDALSLAPLAYFFGPIGPGRPVLQVESVWSTSVARGRSLSEQRYQNRKRPYRRVNLIATAFTPEESMALQTLLARMTQRRFLAPMFSDESEVDGALSATDTTIACTTDDRRFFQGGRVVVYQRRAGAGEWSTFEVATLSAVASGTLTLTSGLANSYTAPVFVAPLIECELQLSAGGGYRFFTDYEADLVVRERVGPMSIPALVTPGTNPSGYQTSGGLPILDPLGIMTKSGSSAWTREGSIVDVGLGTVPDVYGDRARMQYELTCEFLSRDEAWGFLRFAESRAGRAHPFWMVSPSETLTLTSSTIGGSLKVRAVGELEDWGTYRPALAVREHDGTVTIIDLDGATVSVDGSDHLITPASAVSPSIDASDVERLSIARKARFVEDALLEEWTTLDLMRCQVTITELLEEKSVEVANLDRVTTTALEEAFAPGSCPGVQLPDSSETPCTTCSQASGAQDAATVSGLSGVCSWCEGSFPSTGAVGDPADGDYCFWRWRADPVEGGSCTGTIVVVYAKEDGVIMHRIRDGGDFPEQITLNTGEYGIRLELDANHPEEPEHGLSDDWLETTTTVFCGAEGKIVGTHTFGAGSGPGYPETADGPNCPGTLPTVTF